MPPQYSQAICRKSGRTRIFLQRQYLFFLHFTNRFVHIFVYFDLKSTYFGSVSSIMVQIGPIFWYWNNIRKWNFLPPWVLEKKKHFPVCSGPQIKKQGKIILWHGPFYKILCRVFHTDTRKSAKTIEMYMDIHW